MKAQAFQLWAFGVGCRLRLDDERATVDLAGIRGSDAGLEITVQVAGEVLQGNRLRGRTTTGSSAARQSEQCRPRLIHDEIELLHGTRANDTGISHHVKTLCPSLLESSACLAACSHGTMKATVDASESLCVLDGRDNHRILSTKH